MRNNAIISKVLLLVVTLSCAIFAKAQDIDTCVITCNVEMPICSESPVTLSVPANYLYTYRWSNGKTTNSITVKPFQTTTYDVIIYDEDTVELCHPSFKVEVMPRFQTRFQQVKLTCSNAEEENGRNAQAIVMVDSLTGVYDPPYNYQWQLSPLHIAPNDPTWATGLEAFKYYHIKITDNRGCTQRDSVKLRAYPNPVVEITTDPGDTVYLQNPHMTYSFENLSADTLDISNFYWILNSTYDITSTEEHPRFTYVEQGNYTTELKVYNPQGCDTSYFKQIYVNPVKLKIPNVFTPNGDGINDYFIISLDGGSDMPSGGGVKARGMRDEGHEYDNYEPLNRYYESTELTIFNRWGRIVYHSTDYQNNWDGGGLSDGTYFYVLKCHGLKQDATYQGSVMILTAQRQ